MTVFNEEQIIEIAKAVVTPPEKAITRKIWVIRLVMRGITYSEVAEITEYSPHYIYQIVADYKSLGLKGLCDDREGGNHRLYDHAKETEAFESVKADAQKGVFPRAKEMKNRIEESLGKTIPNSTFYKMVHRQSGRKIKPRGQNPKKADKKN